MIEKGNEIVRAPYLKARDRVALVSPAYWVPEEVILQAAETLRAYSHIGACRIDIQHRGNAANLSNRESRGDVDRMKTNRQRPAVSPAAGFSFFNISDDGF